MLLQVNFWDLLLLLIAAATGVAGFGWILIQRTDKQIDKLDKEITALKDSLPIIYQRREDAVRFEALIQSKLESINGMLMRLCGLKDGK